MNASLHPIYKALAGCGVALNTTAAAFNGFAAANLDSSPLAFQTGIHLLFAVGLLILFPWNK